MDVITTLLQMAGETESVVRKTAIMDAVNVIECQGKFTSWDSKKKLLKLLQPEQSDFDWSIVNAMLEGLSDMLPNTNKAHGGDWLKDWLKDFMWEYGLDPADLLMEEKEG